MNGRKEKREQTRPSQVFVAQNRGVFATLQLPLPGTALVAELAGFSGRNVKWEHLKQQKKSARNWDLHQAWNIKSL